jgi:hypothetical protein
LVFFGVVYAHLVYFSHFGMLYQEKSGNPGPETWHGFPQIFVVVSCRIYNADVFKSAGIGGQGPIQLINSTKKLVPFNGCRVHLGSIFA